MSPPKSVREIQKQIGSQGISKKKGQERKYTNVTDFEMPYYSDFLTKDETGLQAPKPLNLHYHSDWTLRLRISRSFARSCANHWRALPNYYWVRWTRLAGEDGRKTCAVHVPATEVYDYIASQWWTCSWVPKPFA